MKQELERVRLAKEERDALLQKQLEELVATHNELQSVKEVKNHQELRVDMDRSVCADKLSMLSCRDPSVLLLYCAESRYRL